MEFTSGEGEQRYAALVRAAAETVVGLDFDGTLAPIVEDPGSAHIHPDAGQVLVDLVAQVSSIAVVTGRPARQALDLGGLEEVGAAIGKAGKELLVFGQYGNERWSSSQRRVVSPRPPAGLSTYLRELPRLLRRAGAADAHVEEKGLAVAVHTRRLAEPDLAYRELLPLVTELAGRHDLVVEPGKNVLEVRAAGMHKGLVVDRLITELDAGGFVFAGDDLGDVEAFEATSAHGRQGLPTLLVCSAPGGAPDGSADGASSGAVREPGALLDLADVVVAGPDGVLDLLREFTADAADLRA